MLRKMRLLVILTIIMGMLALPGVCMAEATTTTANTQLSMAQAYDMALKNSNTIKQDELSVQISEEMKKFRDERVLFTPFAASSPAADAAYTAAVSASISQQMAGKTKTADEDKLFVDVVTEYTDLLAAQEDYAYNQKAIKYAENKWKADSLSYALGLASLVQRNQAEAAYKSAKAAYELSKLGLEKAYQDFNYLVGLNRDARPILTEKPSYSKYEVANLDNAISRAMDQHPTLWNLGQQVNLARINTNLVDVNSGSLKASMLDYEKTQLTASNAVKQTENGLRSLYNGLQQLEETYVTLEQQLKIYQETEKNKKAMYELGMLTKNDYDYAQLDTLKALKALNSTTYRHEIMKINFEKPWTYSSAGSASASSAQ
ncbi:TolC family protein [Syntrophomonas palmitatica]|uniref:TolC family protein n=1 Tax=Syntrophomonas palmitatica TaxID=402877 RepID=UPI0006D022DD|nr:TolC family protein [Syntrophomonas palmitatica]